MGVKHALMMIGAITFFFSVAFATGGNSGAIVEPKGNVQNGWEISGHVNPESATAHNMDAETGQNSGALDSEEVCIPCKYKKLAAQRLLAETKAPSSGAKTIYEDGGTAGTK